jgi:integrase
LFLLEKRRLAASTVNLHLDAIRTFYKLICPDSAVMEGFSHVKTLRRIPQVLSREEVSRLIDAAGNLKHKAVLMMLYSAGLRLMECVRLKPVHIESDRMKVRVEQGKGKRDRYSVLSRKTLETLREYYRRYRPREWLFEGHNGNHLSARMRHGCAMLQSARAPPRRRLRGIQPPSSRSLPTVHSPLSPHRRTLFCSPEATRGPHPAFECPEKLRRTPSPAIHPLARGFVQLDSF